MSTEGLIRVPTLDDRNSCWAIDDKQQQQLQCAHSDACSNSCSAGIKHIWIRPDQKLEYASLKLVS